MLCLYWLGQAVIKLSLYPRRANELFESVVILTGLRTVVF